MPEAAKTNAASSSSVSGTGAKRLSNASGPAGIFMPRPNRRERRSRNAVNRGYFVRSFMGPDNSMRSGSYCLNQRGRKNRSAEFIPQRSALSTLLRNKSAILIMDQIATPGEGTRRDYKGAVLRRL